MYEHSETWTFTTGEVFTLPFATVHKVRDGKVCLWKDYWDYGAIMNAAPAAWVEGLADRRHVLGVRRQRRRLTSRCPNGPCPCREVGGPSRTTTSEGGPPCCGRQLCADDGCRRCPASTS